MLHHKKRGQLTLFIIIGILILFLVSFSIYFMLQTQDDLPTDIYDHNENPVKQFVVSCIERVGEEAISEMGLKGGFIYLPEGMHRSPESFLEADPQGVYNLPYWYFGGIDNVPRRDDMQAQITRYVNENLMSCLGDFSEMDKLYEVKPKLNSGETEPIVKTVTKIAAKDVVITVTLPLELRSNVNSKIIQLNEYRALLDVELSDIFKYARELIAHENNEMFMENITIDLMAMNSDIPFTNIEFHCGSLIWYLDDIKESLAVTLQTEIAKIRFEDVNHTPWLESDEVYEELASFTIEDINLGKRPSVKKPSDAYDYFHYFIDASSDRYPQLTGYMQYKKEWGMDIYSRPSKNGVMRTDMMQGYRKYMPNLCVNVYHFTYDVAYPVLVTLRDTKAFSGRGFTFKFPFYVIIKSNQADRSSAGYDIFEHISPYSGYCDETTGRLVDIRVKGFYEGFFNADIKDVNISFDCFKYYCDLGKTEADDGAYRLRTRLPSNCKNGYLIANKAGYAEARLQDDGSDQLEVQIEKLIRLNMTVVKHRTNDLAQSYPPDSWEVVAVNIISKDSDYSTLAQYDEGGYLDLPFGDHEYEFETIMIDTTDNIISAGYMNNVTITESELADATEIIVHVAEMIPKPILDVEQAAFLQYLYYNKDYRAPLYPEIR